MSKQQGPRIETFQSVLKYFELGLEILMQAPNLKRTKGFSFSPGLIGEAFLTGLDMTLTRLLKPSIAKRKISRSRPPFNAEYVLYLLLRKEEREAVVGDLTEDYKRVLQRFNKRRADIWFYKQVLGSLLPLIRRALLKIGALVWLGRILRRLIS